MPSTADFYDDLAPFYPLIFPDREASVARQGAALDAVIRAERGGDLCGSALTTTTPGFVNDLTATGSCTGGFREAPPDMHQQRLLFSASSRRLPRSTTSARAVLRHPSFRRRRRHGLALAAYSGAD